MIKVLYIFLSSRNDLRQALHWLCLRRSGEEVRSLEPDKLQSELCTILTEMLMTASAEEINGEESEVVKSVTERPSLDCPICFDSFREDAKSIHQLPCSHLFHKPVS
jgi:RING-like zinc finger